MLRRRAIEPSPELSEGKPLLASLKCKNPLFILHSFTSCLRSSMNSSLVSQGCPRRGLPLGSLVDLKRPMIFSLPPHLLQVSTFSALANWNWCPQASQKYSLMLYVFLILLFRWEAGFLFISYASALVLIEPLRQRPPRGCVSSVEVIWAAAWL